jgi:hypothetical protein
MTPGHVNGVRCIWPDATYTPTPEPERRGGRPPVTHCIHGHDLAIVGRTKKRRCKQCARDSARAWKRSKTRGLKDL